MRISSLFLLLILGCTSEKGVEVEEAVKESTAASNESAQEVSKLLCRQANRYSTNVFGYGMKFVEKDPDYWKSVRKALKEGHPFDAAEPGWAQSQREQKFQKCKIAYELNGAFLDFVDAAAQSRGKSLDHDSARKKLNEMFSPCRLKDGDDYDSLRARFMANVESIKVEALQSLHTDLLSVCR